MESPQNVRSGPQPRWWDRYMDPHSLEMLDDPAVPAAVKSRAMNGLDGYNRRSGAYWLFAQTTASLLPASIRRPRILELGAGRGELSARVAEILARRGTPAKVVASDISEDFVSAMAGNARLRSLGIEAAAIDATATGLPGDSFDLAVFTQALHHLSPPQVARLLSEGTRVARQLLIIDGWRHPLLLLASPAFWLLGNYQSFHDGIISLRRMYSAEAIRDLGRQCPSQVNLDINFLPPGYLKCVAWRAD
ncbi:MAG: class I SAM-dependent methyltransferase [Patescibacteria group bacterium]